MAKTWKGMWTSFTSNGWTSSPHVSLATAATLFLATQSRASIERPGSSPPA